MTRRTQRERAEEWARYCIYVDSDGALWITGNDGHATVLGDRLHAVPKAADEALRRVLVDTWMLARRARR